MSVRTVFSDADNNEMECYLNDKGKVFISTGQPGEDIVYSGFITLDKQDLKELIKILTQFEGQMED